jgi:hypothetical protein
MQTDRYKIEDVDSLSPRDGRIERVLKQNHKSMHPIPRPTKSAQVGQSPPQGKIRYHEHDERIYRFLPFSTLDGLIPPHHTAVD